MFRKLFLPLCLMPQFLLAQLPQVKEGNDVLVTLCSISQLDDQELVHESGRAEFGLSFVFLIEKKTAEEGKFALKELVDFDLDGVSYATLSKRETYSNTVVSEIGEYSDKLELWNLVKPVNETLFMTTKIVGDRVELSGELRVAPTFSWGAEIRPQSFPFSVPVSEIPQ